MVKKLLIAIALCAVACVAGADSGRSTVESIVSSVPSAAELRARSLVGLSAWFAAQTQDVVPPPAPDGATKVCPDCDGTGKSSHLGNTFDCPTCDGRGRVPK